jgi:drug/metabolite transporter (DMT)-like permease
MSLAMRKELHLSPYLALFFAILAASSASIFITKAQGDVESLAIAAWRLSLATILLAPLTLIKRAKEFRKINRKQWALIILAGLFLALHFACWVSSLRYTTLASSVILVATSPLWMALLAPIFLHEKLTKWFIIGLSIAFTGSVIVGLSAECTWVNGAISCQLFQKVFSGQMVLGNVLALLGAIFSACYFMVGRVVRGDISIEIYAFIVYGVAAVILLGLVAGFKERMVGFSPENYIWLVALAIIPQIIGHSTFNWALKYIQASMVSLALLGEPVGSILLAFLFLKKVPTMLEVLGGLCILVGVYLATRNERQKELVD